MKPDPYPAPGGQRPQAADPRPSDWAEQVEGARSKGIGRPP